MEGNARIQTKKCLLSEPLFLIINTVAETECIPPFIEIDHVPVILSDFMYLCVDVDVHNDTCLA